MGLYEWLAELSPWIKISLGLLLISVSTILWFSGWFWPWGWIVGVILIMISFPNDAQKKGYHDF